jgi:hypothetical protein
MAQPLRDRALVIALIVHRGPFHRACSALVVTPHAVAPLPAGRIAAAIRHMLVAQR